MIRIKELSNFSELEGLRPIWNGLLQNSRDNDVFSTWQWLWCWWKHFGMGRQLRVLLAEEDDQIVGIAPLMLSPHRFMNIGKINKVTFIGSPESDYSSFILLRNEEECFRAFLGHLMEQSDWDWLDLSDVPEGSLSAKLLCGLSRDLRGLDVEIADSCPYVELPASIDVLTRRLPGHMRKNIRRESQRLSEKYLVAFKTHEDFRSTDEAMDVLFDLHERRMSSRETRFAAFIRRSSRSRDFHKDVARDFADKGWLYLSFLTANDQPVAAGYSFHYRQKSYQYQGGFDPAFGPYSVRTLLHMREVQVCIQRGFKEYDFTRGAEPYKLRWPTKVRKNLRVQLVRKGWLPKMYRRIERNESLAKLVRKYVTIKH
jgi:CelD/BcsL family acetyltransferase involved in cellulose biosynthesis